MKVVEVVQEQQADFRAAAATVHSEVACASEGVDTDLAGMEVEVTRHRTAVRIQVGKAVERLGKPEA